MRRRLDPGPPSRAPRRRRRSVRALAVALCLSAPPASAQLTMPPDFVDDLVLAGIHQPMGIALLPDGRLLFTERTGARIRLIANGVVAVVDPVLTVPNVRTTGSEQGLLGIAADPGWPGRPYLYIHHDYSGSATIRVSRYTAGGDLAFTGNGSLTSDPATRYDILTDIPDLASNHNGGTLRFGPDGKLYVSLGDDASSCQAQDLTVLAGRILRLDVSALPAGGGGPPAKSLITLADTPYVGHADGRAVVGGVIYRRPATGVYRFPPEYDGDIFFSGFYSSWVRRLKETGGTWALAVTAGRPNGTDWATGGTWVADWLTAPDGSLWYCRMLSGGGGGLGQLRRIRYTGVLSVPVDPVGGVGFRAPWPSPSHGAVSFAFTLAAGARIGLAIYDTGGRRVREVFAPEAATAGPHGAEWDGRDAAGRAVAAGVYVAALTVDGARIERRFALIR